jgi:hypothetical protein
MKSAWGRIASSVRDFASGLFPKSRTLEAMRTQALARGDTSCVKQ